MTRHRLTDQENENLIRLCSAVSMDPARMLPAILTMLNHVHPQDAEWIKTRLRITGDNSQAKL